ncbi:hypothetical protein V500_08236 [Pseudogymnoascus sp. VKM F-4518 (FW-2643)]|nr:hypothetical protein V500_08236 [Pseudogymnoascus sp. VKM F-4518 (FW-2643)]
MASRGSSSNNPNTSIAMAKALLPLTLTGGCLAVLTTIWLRAVNDNVPSPYMDEIFHIPQAQQYCASDFNTWDPKLTTPPGLYAFSLLLKAATRAGCSGAELRGIGGVALAALLVVSYFLRESLIGGARRVDRAWEVAQEALNVCLFPPLFFFSGLYYTDVLSTLVIVVAYFAFQRGAGGASVGGGLVAYGLGVVGLVMRQTNVFWVGVFLAGMEWVRTCTDMVAKGPSRGGPGKDASLIERALGPYTRGELHDPPLEEAGPLDFLYCLISIGVSAIALLLSFGAFVVWNGGVVLGTLPPSPFNSWSDRARRQIKPCRDHPPNANALPLAFYSLLLLPPLPSYRRLHPLSEPPQTQHSRLGPPSHRAQSRHRPLQHAHPSFYPRRQPALHVLCLPVHDPAPPTDKVRARTDLRSLRLVRAAYAL